MPRQLWCCDVQKFVVMAWREIKLQENGTLSDLKIAI